MRRAGAAATASYRHTVSEADVAAFTTGVVHRVYGTAAMVRDMEYAARLVLLDLLEPEEEGVGAEVWCRHLAPVPVGATVELLAEVIEQDDRRLICRVQARHHGKLAGEGRVVQVVVEAGTFPPPTAPPRPQPPGEEAGAAPASTSRPEPTGHDEGAAP